MKAAGSVIGASITPSFASAIHKDQLHAGVFGENNTQSVEIIRDNIPLAKIYHAPLSYDGEWNDMNEFEHFSVSEMDEKALAIAIKDLNYHFQQMSGARLEIALTDNPEDIKPPAIVIGALANKMGASPNLGHDLSREAFRIKSVNGITLIGGSSDFGASHGTYTLLEKLGCAWVMPGKEGEIIPRMATIQIPGMDIQEAPDFYQRDNWYGGRPSFSQWQELFEWCLRHKANIRNAKERFGYRAGPHAWHAIIQRFKKEFDENPELMGLIMKDDGSMVRGGNQFETTNPRVIELAIEYLREKFRNEGWDNSANVCIAMGPSDGGALSLSPETVNASVPRVNFESGKEDGTDIIVLFLNAILERTSKEFPNLRLGFMAYSWHTDYPMRYKPHPRIVVSIRDINFSRYHSMLDLTSKSRAYYKDIVLQWGRLAREQGNQISHSIYAWNLAEKVMPYTRLKIDGDDFPIYKEAGITTKGMNLTQDWYLTGPHTYLGAKMAWNTKHDWKMILREYCGKAFGKKAGPFLEKYYLELARRQSESSNEAGSFYAIPLMYDRKFIIEQRKNFDAALAAAGNEMDKKRIAYARYPLETLGHYLSMYNAYTQFDFKAALMHYEKSMQRIEDIASQNIHFTNESGIGYFRGFRRFLDAAVKYSDKDYQIEYKIPDRLKTAFDIYNLGQNNRFWGSKIDDSQYLITSTYQSTWDAQGLMGFQKGSVWYRIRFKLDAFPKKKGGYGLFMGGVDNRLAVWCNDQFIARSQAGLRTPTVFDLSEAVNPGKENILVIQVMRPSLWELFTGGIMMPGFVFSGPRVEQPKDTEPSFRMLPGGVVEPIR